MLQRPAAKVTEKWQSLARLALGGLVSTYATDACPLPYTCSWDGRRSRPEGHSPRYALIALLGLARAERVVGLQRALVERIWTRVVDSLGKWKATAGDVGLGLWYSASAGVRSDVFTARAANAALKRWEGRLDSVEYAWSLLGAERAIEASLDEKSALSLVERCKAALLEHFNPRSGLFYRHLGGARGGGFTRRVPCFANQIYPVMALGVHVQRTGCAKARLVLEAVVSRLCELQGLKGQWCWLYDAREGGVIDPYPVFSVHQDGMAPMALMEAGRALHCSFDEAINRGLQWIYGANELKESLILADEGLVLRDIHAQGVGRCRRAIGAFLACRGIGRRRELEDPQRSYVVNRECRPYHLGWILYAASLACEGVASLVGAQSE